MSPRTLLLPAIFSFGLIATACGSAEVADTAESTREDVLTTKTTASNSASEAPTPTPESETTVSAGNVVPLVGGGQLDLNSVQGTDTVLWFWAPW